jgi:thioredoxin 1
MLLSNLKHIESGADHKKAVSENDNVMIICGHMGAESVAAYEIAKQLECQYQGVKFYYMDYDNPEAQVIRSIPEVQSCDRIPITVFYKNSIVVKATSSAHNKEQIVSILEEVFPYAVNVNSSDWWW